MSVYADIREVPLRGHQTTAGLLITVFTAFARDVFETFRSKDCKANIVIYRHFITLSASFHWSKNTWPWMTLSGLFMLNSVFMLVRWAWEFVAFGGNCVQTNKDRLTLSATQVFSRESSFWRYKVYADICGGNSLEKRRQRTVLSRVNARLELLSLAFENNCDLYYQRHM